MLLEKSDPSVEFGFAEPPTEVANDPEALIEEARRWERRRRYKRVGLAAVAAAVLLVGWGIARGTISGDAATHDSSGFAAGLDRSAASVAPLYGFSRAYAANSTLARVDPKTLAFVGRRLRINEGFSPGTLSPDKSQLLLSNELFPTRRALRASALAVVDLTTMRVERGPQRRLNTDLHGDRVLAATWPTANRILVLAALPTRRDSPRLNSPVSPTLLALDPKTGAVAWRHSLPGMALPEGSGTVGTTTLLVFGSEDPHKLAQATVLTATPEGVLHSSSIRLAAGGYERRKVTVLPPGHKPRFKVTLLGREYQQQLVITAGASPHAYLLTGAGEVYAIDPATAIATRHVVATPAGAPDTSPPDLITNAAPLGSKIAVSAFFPRSNGAPRAGIYLIDPATWTARLIVATTPAWLTSATTLVTFTSAATWASKGTGIQIYDSTGALRHHIEGTQPFNGIASTPLYDYAVIPNPPRSTPPLTNPAQHRAQERSTTTKQLLFDPITGRILGRRTVTGVSPILIGPDARRSRR